MSGLSDSLTIGIVLTLIFGAVCFYLYSRLSQNEKRVGLLENLLMTLKLSTEASMIGPDMVEGSAPAPLEVDDVEEVSEEKYADMLKELSPVEAPTEVEPAKDVRAERPMDLNYEAMSVKELTALAKQRGLTNLPTKKRELIDLMKKQGEPPAAPAPLAPQEGELEGFHVDLETNL